MQRLNSSDLRLPVFVYSGDPHESPTLYREKGFLETCSQEALSNGWYERISLIDEIGTSLKVVEAKFARKGRKAWPGLFAPRLIEVNLLIQPGPELTLEQVKEIVARQILFHRKMFRDTSLNLPEMVAKIRDAASMAQIWSVLQLLGIAIPYRS